MARRTGRKRKAGSRTASGALKRVPVYDYGCEGVRRRQARYARPAGRGETEADPHRPGQRRKRGSDTSQTFDAVGRAWSAGLLGPRGEELMAGARVIAAQYWRVYGFATPDSLARFQPVGPVGLVNSERERIIEDALADTLTTVAKAGRDVRRAFDQLVIDMNPDAGPPWLDRIIFAQRQHHSPTEPDSNMLRLAMIGLACVA